MEGFQAFLDENQFSDSVSTFKMFSAMKKVGFGRFFAKK